MGFQAQYAVSPWNEFNATWNNSNFIGGASLPIGNIPNTLGWQAITATNLFRNWVSGPEPNNGLIITGYEDPASNSSRWFTSSNCRQQALRRHQLHRRVPLPYANLERQSVAGHFAQFFHRELDGHAFTPPGCPPRRLRRILSGIKSTMERSSDGSTVSQTSAQFNASSLGIGNGSTVGFRSQAIDIFGNRTPAGNATAWTTISSSPPTVDMNPCLRGPTLPTLRSAGQATHKVGRPLPVQF